VRWACLPPPQGVLSRGVEGARGFFLAIWVELGSEGGVTALGRGIRKHSSATIRLDSIRPWQASKQAINGMCLRKTGLWTSVPVYARIGRDLVIDKGDKERTQAGWLAGGCRNRSSRTTFSWVGLGIGPRLQPPTPPRLFIYLSVCPSVRLSGASRVGLRMFARSLSRRRQQVTPPPPRLPGCQLAGSSQGQVKEPPSPG
jgi:hypothetical protein